VFVHDAERRATYFVISTLPSVRVGWFVHDAERRCYSGCISTLTRRAGLDVYSRRGASCYSICISDAPRLAGLDGLFTTRSVVLLCLRKHDLNIKYAMAKREG